MLKRSPWLNNIYYYDDDNLAILAIYKSRYYNEQSFDNWLDLVQCLHKILDPFVSFSFFFKFYYI